MELESLIQEQGGKFGVLTYLIGRIPDLPIKQYEVRKYNKLNGVSGLKFNRIVRSSHPAEFWGLAGLLETVKDVDYKGIKEAVRKIEKSFRRKDLQIYAEQNNIDLGDCFYVGIQEQSDSKYNGSIMRHPNNPDVIFVHFSEGEENSRRNWLLKYGHDQDIDSQLHYFDPIETKVKKEIAELKEFYEQIEKSGLLPEYSLQVEFGLDPLSIYQARPFKRFETADFEVPLFDVAPNYRTDMVFGITSQEGIALPVLRGYSVFYLAWRVSFDDKNRFISDPDLFAAAMNFHTLDGIGVYARDIKTEYISKVIQERNLRKNNLFLEGYLFSIDEAHREPYLLDNTIPNMNSFHCARTGSFLTHNIFRQLQHSSISLLGVYPLWSMAETGDVVRIISNGKNAVVVMEKED